MQEQVKSERDNQLFYFRKFFDNSMVDLVVEETNGYVKKIATSPEPPAGYKLHGHMKWLPVWVESWVPLTIARLWRWIATILWMGMQKTALEEEMWSRDPLLHQPVLSQSFFTRDEHTTMKAALHCQGDHEQEGEVDCDGKPMLRKIGKLYEMARSNWHKHYIPRADIAYYEITIPMSGRSYLKKQLQGKKIGAGIQLLGFAESTADSQYLYDASVDQNTG
eukprot:3933500-Rhodomonas_salina.1